MKCSYCNGTIGNDELECKTCSEVYITCSYCKEEYRLGSIEKTSKGVYLCSECWGNAPR
jgi:hypothetical protein